MHAFGNVLPVCSSIHAPPSLADQGWQSRALLHGSAALTEGITLSLCNHTFPSPCTQSEVNATGTEHSSWLTHSGGTEEQSPPTCWVVFITQELQQDPALWPCSSPLASLAPTEGSKGPLEGWRSPESCSCHYPSSAPWTSPAPLERAGLGSMSIIIF